MRLERCRKQSASSKRRHAECRRGWTGRASRTRDGRWRRRRVGNGIRASLLGTETQDEEDEEDGEDGDGDEDEDGAGVSGTSMMTNTEFMSLRGALLTANLPQLQNLIKRDPAGYKEEFLQQYNHYNSTRQLFIISPGDNATHFRELVTFIAQVSPLFPSCWLIR